jgi:hypothetical protein
MLSEDNSNLLLVLASTIILGFGTHDHIFYSFQDHFGARIAQTVQRLAMGWTTEGSEFKSR